MTETIDGLKKLILEGMYDYEITSDMLVNKVDNFIKRNYILKSLDEKLREILEELTEGKLAMGFRVSAQR